MVQFHDPQQENQLNTYKVMSSKKSPETEIFCLNEKTDIFWIFEILSHVDRLYLHDHLVE